MTTLESRRKIQRGYVPRTALARAVEASGDAMHVFLTDGRILSVTLLWFPRLWAQPRSSAPRWRSGAGAWACTGRR
jgi:hypothetical protein